MRPDTKRRTKLSAICLSSLAAVAIAGPVFSQPIDSSSAADQSLKLYAVHVLRIPRVSWVGYGVYIGNGLILTAAHVVGREFWTKIHVEIAGKELPAAILKQGSFADVDLALLSIDALQLPVSLRLRRMGICKNSSLAG